MAEALAVLGAVAASSQLAERCLVITNLIAGLYLKIRNAPELIRKQTVRVEQFISIARLVQHNPSLQTDLVASVLRNCFATAGQLEKELRKISVSAEDGKAKQIWTVLVGLTGEEKILALFERLDQEKSILALCIETIDSALLHTIYLEFVKVRTTVDDVSKELPAIRDTARKVTTVFEALPYITRNASTLSSLDIKIATIHDELLPAVRELQLKQQASIPFAEETIVEDHFMVPFARNEGFIGQHSLMEELSAKIEKGKKHSRVALVGLGGIGKSQIALEYAYRRREESKKVSIYWIHASNALRFEQDYIQIGLDLKLPGIDDPRQDTKQLVKSWLSNKESGTWLMIVDNADDVNLFFGPKDTRDLPSSKRLSEFLPQSSNGSIVFTTRNKKAGIKFATASGVIVLPKMDPVDAEELLETRLGEGVSGEGDATELLSLLEYLPLAVSQAASYIAENSISISEYLQMYNGSEASRIELLSEDFEDLARDPETRNPVAVTWAISFDQIRQSNVLAANLLSFMACVDRQGVPKVLLPLAESPVKLSSALGLLKAYSLITANQGDMAFDVHRLVHLATRNWLRLSGAFVVWAKLSSIRVSEVFPSGEYGTLETCDSYYCHAQAILGFEQLTAAIDISRACLAYNVSRYLQNRGRYNAAELPAEQSARWREELLGPEHPYTLQSKGNLAGVLNSRGKYREAEEMYRRALELSERVLGPEHPHTLASVNNLAWVLRSQGKYGEAEETYRQALEPTKKVLGPEHPGTLMSMSNLAMVLWNQGEYMKAEEIQRHTLELREKVLGPEHPDTLMSMNGLAEALGRQGKYMRAEEMHQHTLELKEKVLGPEHPDTLVSASNLAEVLGSQGKYMRAEEMHQHTLELKEKVLGPEHPDTLASMGNLALLLWRRGRNKEAGDMQRRTLELMEKVLGPEHPDTLTSMGNLAAVLRDQGRYKEAEEMLRQTLELREKVLGPEHPNTLTSMSNLAERLDSRGKCGEAEETYQRVLESREKVLGPEHVDTLMSMNNLAVVLWNQGRYKEAEEMLRQTLELREKVLGLEHPDTLTSMGNLAAVLRDQGRYKEAEEMLRQTLESKEKVLGPEHPDSLISSKILAGVLGSQDKYGEAEETYRRALESSKKVLGPEHPDTLVSMGDLAAVLWKQGKYKEAREVQRRTLESSEKVLGLEHPETLTSRNNLAVMSGRTGASTRRPKKRSGRHES